MGGFWDGEFVNAANIQVKQCNNKTSNNTCATKEYIKNKFKSSALSDNYFFSYLYMEALPILENYDNPLKTILTNRYDMLNLKLNKKHVQKFKEVQINDDRGWIFSEIKSNSVYSSDSIDTDFTFKDEWEQDILFNHFMYFGRKVEIYNRSYKKIQEVIAVIGGFSKLFYIIVSIIYSFYGDIEKNIEMYKESSYLKNGVSINTEIDSNKLSILSQSPVSKINKLDFQKKAKIDIKYNYFICNMIFNNKQKNENNIKNQSIAQYYKIKKYYDKKLDIISYIKLVREFDLLKNIVLDDIQRNALEIIEDNYIIKENEDEKEFMPKLREYMSNENNYRNTDINKRLFKYFEDNQSGKINKNLKIIKSMKFNDK